MPVDDPELEYLVHEVRNRNEVRVVNLIPVALANHPGYTPDSSDYDDIYALTLNNLAPRYAQHLTLVFEEAITDAVILDQLDRAIRRVRANPH
jgi:hypothetical protein